MNFMIFGMCICTDFTKLLEKSQVFFKWFLFNWESPSFSFLFFELFNVFLSAIGIYNRFIFPILLYAGFRIVWDNSFLQPPKNSNALTWTVIQKLVSINRKLSQEYICSPPGKRQNISINYFTSHRVKNFTNWICPICSDRLSLFFIRTHNQIIFLSE